ncbi:uncharacterized protein LOC132923225 [Rhopalosiphum padi]|uniref:uncharacterized protein LOC132923225 n=1 Tax=Rhopalosiphum padi TaxID=40932 RepID=UPI00298D89E8|nr:uncharacterized protein LOC132923225 [Rhopalosiphum padi]XP_060843065.1 uncharacterized protein LOC132923225 [Rhopalosiphum padi]XP_060843066.1 uncharacterized protein LOC132923225 [Rhopalosiphum padi]
MSDNENPTPSPTLCKPSSTTNKMYTPCRRVGLKRKSIGILTPKTISKKMKFIDETSKSTEFTENANTLNIKAKDKSISKLEYEDETTSNVPEKRRVIEELKSELKNSEQHNLEQIKKLSKKWLNVCQEALTSLFNKLSENENSNLQTIEDLIKNLGICPDLIQFDSNNQEFY